MFLAYKKRKDLFNWLIVYIITTFGTFVDTGTEILDPSGFGNLIRQFFYLLAVIIFCVVVMKDYYETFLRNRTSIIKLSSIGFFSLQLSFFIMIYTTGLIITTFCIVFIIMLLKIYFKRKTITDAFISFSIMAVLLAGILNLFERAGYTNLKVYSIGMNIIFNTLILATAIVAILDQKLKIAQSDKLYMKDKYSHDLGNIFHTISMAYELITMSINKDILQEDMDKIIKIKINEASELVRFIRNL